MVFQGRFEGVVFMEFPSYFKDVSRVLQGSSMGILRRCQGCFMKSPSINVFNDIFFTVGCFKIRIFQGCFSEVEREFQEGFKCVEREVSKVFNFKVGSR